MSEAKDYVPGLGTEFQIKPDEIDVDALAAKLPTGGGADVTKAYVDNGLAKKADSTTVYTKTEADSKFATVATLNGKLTATKAAAIPVSTAADVAELLADFNAAMAKLKAAGITS